MALTLTSADHQAIASRVGYSTTEVLLVTDPAFILISLNQGNVILAMEDLLKWRDTGTSGTDAWPALFKEAVLDKLASMIAVSLQQRVELGDYFEKRAMEAIALLRGQDDWKDADLLRESLATGELEAWNYSFATQDVVCTVTAANPSAPEYVAQVTACVDVLRLIGLYQEKRELRWEAVGPAYKLYDYRADGGNVIMRATWLLPEADWPALFASAVDLRVIAHKAAVWERDVERSKALQDQADKMISELRRMDMQQRGRDIEEIGRSEMELYPWHWNRKGMSIVTTALPGPSELFSSKVLLTRDQVRIDLVSYQGRDLRYERCGMELNLYDSVAVGESVQVFGQWYVPPTEWPETFRRACEYKAMGEREMLAGPMGTAAKAERYFAQAATMLERAKSADSQQQTAVRIQARGIARARQNASTTWSRSRN
jgi:hypothetical protein